MPNIEIGGRKKPTAYLFTTVNFPAHFQFFCFYNDI